jgi:general secretion pathway protein C
VLKVASNIVARVRAVLTVALLVYLAFLFAKVFWFSVSPSLDVAITLPQKSGVAQKVDSKRSSQLARYHLFGESGRQQVKREVAPQEAPKTRLRLVLKGVFTSEQDGASGAIVEEIGKPENYYSIGDVLPGNATLEEVYTDRVLLRRNGKLETLAFQEKSVNAKNQIAKSVKPVNKTKNKPRRVSRKIKTPEQFIEEATQRLGADPSAALKSAGLSASDGGYVYQGGNPMLSGLNLEKGDVIRSVNGHPLGDVKKDKSLMKSLYDQGSLEVEIVRNGASFYINYPLR